MPQTLEEKVIAAKINRSRALMNKINVLYSRDGSDAPPIESMKEQDEFNLKLFFGESGTETINWDHPGVEGIIRMYYEMIYILTGKVRNNIIKAGYNDSDNTTHNTTNRSGMQEAAVAFKDGYAHKAGFYIGWDGLQSDINDASGIEKATLSQVVNKGRMGEFQVEMTEGWPSLAVEVGAAITSSTFSDNRDKYTYFDSTSSPPKWREKYPENEESIITLIDDCLNIIGVRSPLGPNGPFENIPENPFTGEGGTSGEVLPKDVNQLIQDGLLDDSILGRRLADVYPETIEPQSMMYSGSGGFGGGTPPSTTVTWDRYTYGNGTYDKEETLDSGTIPGGLGGEDTTYGPPSGYNDSFFDYWDSNLQTKLTAIKSKFTDLRTYIEYSKVEDETYLINPNIPPGKTTAWSMQNTWLDKLDVLEPIIDSFLDDVNPHISGDSTDSAQREYINNRVDTFKDELNGIRDDLSILANTLDDNTTNTEWNIIDPIFGSVDDIATLYGLRFMAVRMILDSQDGSKTAVESIGTAIGMMERKLDKAEEELEMYGIPETEWIYTPEVVGIEPHYRLNQATFEMEIVGWMVVWAGQDHCTSYDLQRSLDYDPSTEIGTFTTLIPGGQSYTVVDRDANTGKVFMYYIDTNGVGPDDNPYYRAKAYDNGGSSGTDYYRTPTESAWSEPKSPEDIEAPETKMEKPPKAYDPKEPVKTKATPAEIPPNALAWTTNWTGDEAEDIDRTIFRSEVPFDSIGSNLMVFVNERFKNPDKNEEYGDYELLDTYTIKFRFSVDPTDEVNLHVFLRSFHPHCLEQQDIDVYTYYEDLPSDEDEGQIVWVIDERKFYSWSGSNWEDADDPFCEDIDQWKGPVDTYEHLPTIKNSDGDIRLVTDENIIYRWSGELEQWLMISGSSGTGHWKPPVDTVDDLPDTNNINGDLRLVVDEERLYRWNEGIAEWQIIDLGGTGGSAIWAAPVETFDDLPDPATQFNEVRLVIDEGKIYRWDSEDTEWVGVNANALLNHDELLDMPDEGQYHDGRYYTESEMDSFLHDIQERLGMLEELKPRDAQELSGDFTITGTAFSSGYLAYGSHLRYDTLVPEQLFPRITRDVNFILNNSNLEQFKDADEGELKLYINDVEVDSFDLAGNFDESEREDGQSYPPQWGPNEKIFITNITPYNNYPIYQRGDYELHFVEDDFEPGENKIHLVHEIMVEGVLEERATDEFIFFFDSNNAYRGFQNTHITLEELNSNTYLSGVRYLDVGDKINISFIVERMFNDAYPFPKQVEIDASDFGIDEIEINHTSDNVVGTVTPAANNQYTYSKEFTLSQTNMYSIDPVLTLTPYTVYGADPQLQWSDSGMLINTVTQKSDDKNEYFEDEVYRMPVMDYDTIPTSITENWDSTVALTIGHLQVYNEKLIYPQHAYNSNLPAQYLDYTGFSGEGVYYRAFYDSDPHSNGMLLIDGFTYTDQNIKAEIKLPSQTGWLDLLTQYNAATFTGSDGDGCLIKVENNQEYYFTTGAFSTANSGYMIMFRITFQGGDINTLRRSQIHQISIDW